MCLALSSGWHPIIYTISHQWAVFVALEKKLDGP